MKTPVKTAIVAALAMMTGLSAFAVEAKVTSVSGKVQKQEKGASAWTDVKQNDVLKEGTMLSTGFNSSVTINIDGSICTLQPLTRMSLEQLSQKDVSQNGKDKTVTKTALYIDTGKASFKVNSTDKKLNDFKVHSPASTASVRGTEFTFYSVGTVRTLNGLVAVSAGRTREQVASTRDSFYVAPEEKPSVFTPIKDVGGGNGGGTPVFAGNSVTTNIDTGIRQDPVSQKQSAAGGLAGNTASLAAKEARAPMTSGQMERPPVAPIEVGNTEVYEVSASSSSSTSSTSSSTSTSSTSSSSTSSGDSSKTTDINITINVQ